VTVREYREGEVSKEPQPSKTLRAGICIRQNCYQSQAKVITEVTIRSRQIQLAPRRAVDPPIEVQAATWSLGGQLDWWVKDRLEWFGRVRDADGRQRWIRAVDLRPASGSQR
jgi:hypothetical protein